MNTFLQTNRSALLLGGLLAICLMAGNIWAISKMLASQAALTNASDELAKNQRMVAEIKRLKERPRVASFEEEAVTGMQERIQLAMQDVGIPEENKTSSTPLEAVQKGQTDYKERRTEIILIELTLPQIVRFCQRLEDPEKGLTVRDLTMKASKTNKSSPSDVWDVTIKLNQLIFSVPSAPL